MRRFGWIWAGVILSARPVLHAEVVAPGVTYTFYSAAGPNRVYVVQIDRLRSEYKLKLGWPQKKRNYNSLQTVSTIVAQYDAPPDRDVLAAVNASFFGPPPAITGMAASEGEILEPPSASRETFLFGPTRLPLIRQNISLTSGTLTFADGTTTSLTNSNIARPPDTLIAYTPQWDSSTRTTTQGVEVILSGVSYPMRGDKEVAGVVTALQTGAASLNNAIPPGGMVLSAIGTPVATITSKVQVGHRLRMKLDISDNRLNNMDMAITGTGWLLDTGAANASNWSLYAFSTERHPRTVLAWNSSSLFFMVCDGRCTGSVGMTFQEMADFLTGTLGATDALNLDGGGSSTMWVNGSVRNIPSDSCGTARSVANAVMLVQQDTATNFPFTDAFTSAGRLAAWDDKFRYNAVGPFAPSAPGGDGSVITVMDPAGGEESMRRGDFSDANYAVEADVYCEYRPGLGSGEFERYCIFARDNGQGALGLNSAFGLGNCYALTFDSNTGRIRAAKYLDGAISDFLPSQLFMPSTTWRRFRIECFGSQVRYFVDGNLIATAIDSTHVRGYFGIGYHEFFTANGNMHGTRADNFAVSGLVPPHRATNPSPANSTTSASVTTSLGWSPASDAVSHDVYFGSSNPGAYRGNQLGTTFDPGILQVHHTYYWRIDEINAFGTTMGDVWSFTTTGYRADFDDDGDVDQTDFGFLQACFSGPIAPGGPPCDRAQLGGGAGVDSDDLNLFLACMAGSGLPPPAPCLE